MLCTFQAAVLQASIYKLNNSKCFGSVYLAFYRENTSKTCVGSCRQHVFSLSIDTSNAFVTCGFNSPLKIMCRLLYSSDVLLECQSFNCKDLFVSRDFFKANITLPSREPKREIWRESDEAPYLSHGGRLVPQHTFFGILRCWLGL